MPLIQNPGPGRKLQRGLRLTELPDSVLAPEIVGVVLLEDYTDPLSDITRGAYGASNQNGVAAENAMLSLTRVGASDANYDLIVTEAHFSCTADQVVRIGIPLVALTGLTRVAATFSDTGIPGQPTSFFAVASEPGIPAARLMYQFRALAETSYIVKMKVRLGDASPTSPAANNIFIAGVTVNVGLFGGFAWTEATPQG